MVFDVGKFSKSFVTADADEFVTYLSDDTFLRDGSSEPLGGKEAVRKALSDLFRTLNGIKLILYGLEPS